MSDPTRRPTLGDLGESGILAEVFAALPAAGATVLVPPGDDAALLRVAGHRVVATTDALVRDRDWRDEWSSAADVGAKAVVQNLADVAAMGGVGTGLLVTLVAPPSLAASWAQGLVQGIVAAATPAGVPVLGGDLSSSAADVVVSVTALGEVDGAPVLRSGARPGQVIAVSEALGRSGAGWWLLRHPEQHPKQAQAERWREFHRRPSPDLTQGPVAAAAGAGAMIDVSDGLLRDAGRIAGASAVHIDLDPDAVAAMARRLGSAVPQEVARDCVLTGGEEHCLLATFDPDRVPSGWHRLGLVGEGQSVTVGGREPDQLGWDHFGG